MMHDWRPPDLNLGTLSSIEYTQYGVTNMPDYTDAKTLTMDVVIVYSEDGKCILYGDTDQTTKDLFKIISSVWSLDPATETAKTARLTLKLPNIALLPNVVIDQD